VRRLLLVALAVLGLSACGGASKPQVQVRPGLVGEIVRVDGRWMHAVCTGYGSPTVVLEAGADGSSWSWSDVLPSVARFARVCAYDRFGDGASDPAPPGQTAQAQVDQLRKLLSGLDVKPPYVLAGHSWGGLLARLFAAEHPRDIAGLVLVDTVSTDEFARDRAAAGRRGAIDYLLWEGVPDALANSSEHIVVGPSLDEARKAGTLGDTRLVVLSVVDPPVSATGSEAGVLVRVHLRTQDEIARLSTDSVHAGVPYTDHQSFLAPGGRPDAVLAAIRGVVQSARAGTRLPLCARFFAHVTVRCRR
jgi:pimeloyl-ACP methyl ester carboxylesterase